MSTQTVSERFHKAIQELRAHPLLLAGTALGWGLLISVQAEASIAGPILTAMTTTVLLASLFKRGRLPWRPLLALGAIVFPLNALWTVMSALFRNTIWVDPFSSAWSLPIIYCMCAAVVVIAHAARAIAVENVGLDRGLKLGWWRAIQDARMLSWTLLYLTMTAMMALAVHAVFFILLAPLGLALIKISADYSSEAGVRT